MVYALLVQRTGSVPSVTLERDPSQPSASCTPKEKGNEQQEMVIDHREFVQQSHHLFPAFFLTDFTQEELGVVRSFERV